MLRKSKYLAAGGHNTRFSVVRGRRPVSEAGGDELRGVRTGATDRACES